MKKGFVRLAVVLSVCTFVFSCTGGDGYDSCRSDCPRPAWADVPPELGAVGIAQGINVGMGRKLATDNGRQELARQISVKVMGLLEQSAQQVVGAEPGVITGHQYAEEITRTLHKQFLSGSRAIQYWEDCCTGETYALVTIEKEGLLAAANMAAKEAANKILKIGEEKHKELEQKLDENIAREFGN